MCGPQENHGQARPILSAPRPDETTLTAQRIAQHRHLLITQTGGPARLVHLDSA
ncbi:MAG: hypothetical protein JO115_12530 [Pseudonocardiales bacterium]|nr:hypothetical protein [Pseudonocardiales bacterium]